MSDFFYEIIIIAFCVAALYISLIEFRKSKFFHNDKYKVFWSITPFPPLFNYWLIKIFLLTSSLFVLYSIW